MVTLLVLALIFMPVGSYPGSSCSLTVQRMVEDRFGDEAGVALAVIEAESGCVSDARNPDSSASGLFQFLDSTWGWVAEASDGRWVSKDDVAWQIWGAWWLSRDLPGRGWHHWVVCDTVVVCEVG